MADTRDNINAPVDMQRDDDWDRIVSIRSSPPPVPNKDSNPMPTPTSSSIPVQGGGSHKVGYRAEQFKDQYLDERTREPLLLHLVKAAVIDELD